MLFSDKSNYYNGNYSFSKGSADAFYRGLNLKEKILKERQRVMRKKAYASNIIIRKLYHVGKSFNVNS